MSRWLKTAALAMLLALAAHSQSAQAQSTWIPPYCGGSGGGTRPSTNCASAGSGCTSCSYRRSSRGLLATADDPATAAAAAATASTASATATRVTRRPLRGGSSGSVSFGGSSGGGTYNPWTGGSSSGGGSSGGTSGGSGSWSCNSCSGAGYYKLTQQNGLGTCGESARLAS